MLIPYGLDDARVERWPWVSTAIVALCVLAWIGTDLVSDGDRRLGRALGAVERYLATHPGTPLPPELRRFGTQARLEEEEAQEPGADAAAEQTPPELAELAQELVQAWEDRPLRRLGLVPARGLLQAGWITHLFLHGGFLHLLGNMLVFFLICGPFLEDAWGPRLYLGFYLAAGLVAAAAQVLPDLHSQIPLVGASGAISGCLGAFSVRFAQRKVRVFYWFFLFLRGTVLVPAWIWGLLGLAGDLAGVVLSGGGGGVAYGAHVGGFLFGAAAAAVIGGAGHEATRARARARAQGEFVLHPDAERGDAALQRGDLAEARRRYRAALAAGAHEGEVRLRLLRLELGAGDARAAAAELDRLSSSSDRALVARAAAAAHPALDPAILRPAVALRLAEALGPIDREAALRLALAAAAGGGALGARACTRAAELQLERAERQEALELARRAAATPGAPAEVLERARRVAEAAAAALAQASALGELPAGAGAGVEGAPPPPAAAATATARVHWCRVEGLDDEALTVRVGDRQHRVPLGRVRTLAVGVVDALGPPGPPGRAAVLDLGVDPGGGRPPAVLRLPGPWLGLGALHPGVPPGEAFARLVRHLLARSGATPLPGPAAVTGPTYARFPDLAAFEAACAAAGAGAPAA